MQITIEITKSQNTYTIYNNLQENLNVILGEKNIFHLNQF